MAAAGVAIASSEAHLSIIRGRMMSGPPSLRREVLASFAILFAGGVLLAGVGVLLAYPLLRSTGVAVAYLLVLLAGDLLVVFLFGRKLLESQLVRPVSRLVEDTERIAGGEYHHRVEMADAAELQAVGRSVNALADRLIREQKRLAENVASLVETNEQLVEARTEVMRTARLASAGSLAAGIAHEVGNPLSAIMSYVDVARRRAESGSSDPEILDSIRDEAHRIDRIVQGLLDYARPGGDDSGPADPAEVVERVVTLLDQQGRLDGVDVERHVEEGVTRVHMDAHRLEHVLMNLLLNGVDALEGRQHARIGIHVGIEAGRAFSMPRRRQGDPPGVNYMHRRRMAGTGEDGSPDPLWSAAHVVVLRVEDNGPGIPEGDLERVFDPFFTTKDPGKGTGLGLSIGARLVEGMGGQIEAENVEGGGARFTIRLPGASDTWGGPVEERTEDRDARDTSEKLEGGPR